MIMNNIDSICKKYNIDNYQIVNGLVNVDDNVDLASLDLYEIPLHFGIVTGNFDISGNNISSLKGSPICALGFYCDRNKLTTLEFITQNVSYSIDCSYNEIQSLKYIQE